LLLVRLVDEADHADELNEAEVIALFEGVPNFTIALTDLQQGINATDLLAVQTTIFSSKGEAKKMIQGGGVAINKIKIDLSYFNNFIKISEKVLVI